MLPHATLKILICAICEENFLFAQNMLLEGASRPCELKWVANAVEARAAIEREPCDACLIDTRPGTGFGLDFLRNELANFGASAIIVVTAQEDRDVVLQAAVQAGASDVLVRELLTAPLLEHSIRMALERKRAQHMLLQRNNELALLIRASAAIGSTLDLHEILASVLEELHQRWQVVGTFWLLDPATGELVCHTASGPFADTVRDMRLQPGQGIAGWALQHDTPLIVPDSAKDQRHYAPMDIQMAMAYRSILCVPLRGRNKAIGMLQLLDEKLDRFRPADIFLAESLANAAALAIENARLYQQVQDDLRERQQALDDLRLTDARLAASETRLRTIIDAEVHGVVVVNMEGLTQFVNPAAQRLFGRSREQLLENPFGFPVKAGDVTELELLLPDHRSISVEMRAVQIDWEGSPCFLTTLHDISERKRLEHALRELSLRDGLTDLFNQRGFQLMGEQVLAMARRQGRSTVLLFVDMDGMKSINDTLGHQEGDKALIAVARILRESFRGTDIIARLGGDEFAILALQTSDIGTDSMQAGLRANLERANANSGSPFRLELSVGAIVSGPDDPMALAQLLAMADEQMYQQKRGRKHRAHGFADIREGPGRRSESDSRRGQ